MSDLKIDLATLAGLAEDPGEVPGWGPVIADVARQIVKDQPQAKWQATVTDPVTGQVVWEGTTRRRPTSMLRRHVEVATQPVSFLVAGDRRGNRILITTGLGMPVDPPPLTTWPRSAVDTIGSNIRLAGSSNRLGPAPTNGRALTTIDTW